jgi:hypothetical protein
MVIKTLSVRCAQRTSGWRLQKVVFVLKLARVGMFAKEKSLSVKRQVS